VSAGLKTHKILGSREGGGEMIRKGEGSGECSVRKFQLCKFGRPLQVNKGEGKRGSLPGQKGEGTGGGRRAISEQSKTEALGKSIWVPQ